MSRWASDPEAAADALIERTLDDLALHGRVLLVNQAGVLPGVLERKGCDTVVWNRRKIASRPAEAWPSQGPFDIALVRLPKARDEQEMTAHAVLSVLAPEGRLIVYGGNDEGIRSAAKTLQAVSGEVETVAARGHGRVLSVVRPQTWAGVKGTLQAWRIVGSMQIEGISRPWVSYPGVFAAGRMDEGTALLLTALPPLGARVRVLDYGCGSGVIGAAVQAREAGVTLDMLDSDAVALEATRENVPSANALLGTSLSDAGRPAYDLIISNPPLHQGIAEDHGLLERLIAEAPAHLRSDGVLQIVVQRRIPLERLFAEHFDGAEVVAENGRFRVWRARPA